MTIKQQAEIDRAEFAVMVRKWVHSGIGSVGSDGASDLRGNVPDDGVCVRGGVGGDGSH